MIRTNLFKLIGEGLEKIADAVENKPNIHGSPIRKTTYSSRPSTQKDSESNTQSTVSSPVPDVIQSEPVSQRPEDQYKERQKKRFHSDFVAFVSFFQDLLLDEDLATENFSVHPTDADQIELRTRTRGADLILNYHQSVCTSKFMLKIRPHSLSDPRFSDEVILDLPDHLSSFHLSHKFGYRRVRSLILWIQTMLEEVQLLPAMDEMLITQNRQLLMHNLKDLLSERDFGMIGQTFNRHYVELSHTRYSIRIEEKSDTLEHAILRIVGMRTVSHSKRPDTSARTRYSPRSGNIDRSFHIPILQMVPANLNARTPDYNRAEALLNLVHQLAEDILIRESELMQKIQPL